MATCLPIFYPENSIMNQHNLRPTGIFMSTSNTEKCFWSTFVKIFRRITCITGVNSWRCFKVFFSFNIFFLVQFFKERWIISDVYLSKDRLSTKYRNFMKYMIYIVIQVVTIFTIKIWTDKMEKRSDAQTIQEVTFQGHRKPTK